jgi:hypothetical protein
MALNRCLEFRRGATRICCISRRPFHRDVLAALEPRGPATRSTPKRQLLALGPLAELHAVYVVGCYAFKTVSERLVSCWIDRPLDRMDPMRLLIDQSRDELSPHREHGARLRAAASERLFGWTKGCRPALATDESRGVRNA